MGRVLRISQLVVQQNGQDDKVFSYPFANQTQKNVLKDKAKVVTGVEQEQMGFWRAFGACMDHKGGRALTFYNRLSGYENALRLFLPFNRK